MISTINIPLNPFDNLFDLAIQDISTLVIKENNRSDNCYFEAAGKIYGGFIIISNPSVKTICKVSFHKSKADHKYLPRLEFRKVDKAGNQKQSKGHDVIVNFGEGDDARNFWKMIHFLQGFKELVDMGDFHSRYQAVSFENYYVEFQNKGHAERIQELKSLAEKTKLSDQEIKELLFPQRKNTIHWFYAFLKDLSKEQKTAFAAYKEKHAIIEQGEEPVWHHFLKTNDWIIGLNVDIKFIRDLFSEQKVGEEDSKGRGNPTVDFLGVSYFTTLIELKTSKTPIFKKDKSNRARSNTWDFSNDFIEAYSQTLAQRTDLHYNKQIVDEQGEILDTQKHRILDPKSVLIIGNRNVEFPHVRSTNLNTKSDCFERFRRDKRNVEIVTFDEIFERAFHIVYSEKLPRDWWDIESKVFIHDVLRIA